MGISFSEQEQQFLLSTNDLLYVFEITKNNYLKHVYFGKKTNDVVAFENTNVGDPWIKQDKEERFSMSGFSNEYGAFGIGDYREVAIKYTRNDGSRNNNLKFKSYKIVSNKTKLNELPSLDGNNELIVTLADKDVEVDLHYSVYEAENIIVRHVAIRNLGEKIILNTVNSFNLDLKGIHDVYSLSGWWGHERQIIKHNVNLSILNIDSKRGLSSHYQNPLLIIADKDTSEDKGLAIGLNLVYSGSFSFKAEHTIYDDFRVVGGINDFDFDYPLEKGKCFETPEVVISYSNDGLNKMSQQFHDVYRHYLINKNFVFKTRPIVANNWETTRFDFTEEKIFNLIDKAKKIGIDTFVLDDGWFGHRDNELSSLGDWYPHKARLPKGLKPIIDKCKQNGLKFGLWIEPEMISEDSDLYKAHPDWALTSPDGIINLHRHQLILNLTKPECFNYIKNIINSLLDNNDISYVKWDCNRYYSEYFADNLKNDEQASLFYRNMVATYKLMDEIVLSHPRILFEGCAAGGARFDPGVFKYFSQSWCSDNSDAYSRQFIQYGTSLSYPLSSFTGHISVCPNKQVGTITPFKTRCNMASLCSTGFEIDLTELTKEQEQLATNFVSRYKKISPLILSGDLYRIFNPFEDKLFAEIVVSKDKNKAFAVIANQKLDRKKNVNLKFKGLREDFNYFIEECNLVKSGMQLMNEGIKIYFKEDYDSYSFTLSKK